jgi:hypothetical protein
VRGAKLLGPLKFTIIYIHTDNGMRPGQFGASNGRIAHAATADDGHRVATADASRVDRCP